VLTEVEPFSDWYFISQHCNRRRKEEEEKNKLKKNSLFCRYSKQRYKSNIRFSRAEEKRTYADKFLSRFFLFCLFSVLSHR